MRVEIRPYTDPDVNETYNALYVDNVLFDWCIDPEDLLKAKKMAGDNEFLKKSVANDIQNHFMSCFSEFTGRTVTVKELVKAIQTGTL